MSDCNITNESRYWEIIEELATRGYRTIREIEHDIIDRELFCPDLPVMEYIVNKHRITPDQYNVIAECVHQHLCSNTILKNGYLDVDFLNALDKNQYEETKA